jgi:hypothetical protein
LVLSELAQAFQDEIERWKSEMLQTPGGETQPSEVEPQQSDPVAPAVSTTTVPVPTPIPGAPF